MDQQEEPQKVTAEVIVTEACDNDAMVVDDVDEERECSGSPVVTLGEALEEYEELQKVSNAVLGASDPQNCSYVLGHMKRQALYACMTCNPKNAPHFQPAGVCLACSYKCHDGHDLVELYTKRKFRCDCGNKRFPDNPCILQKDKDDFNTENAYSQNFSGVYCTCHRPYPDPESSTDNADPMVQCIVCEDWFHTQHTLPGVNWSQYDDEDQSLELICHECTPKLTFLEYYDSLRAKPKQSEAANSNSQNDENVTVPPQNVVTEDDKCPSGSQDSGVGSLTETETSSVNNESNEVKTTEEKKVCLITENAARKASFETSRGTVWSDGWRRRLCRCTSCMEKYETLGVSFIVDPEDTIESYEAIGQAKSESEMIRAEESLNKQIDDLGRVGQLELIAGYNDMKEALRDFLKEFAENGKVVQEKDVQEFFQNLRATKRPRLDLGNGGY